MATAHALHHRDFFFLSGAQASLKADPSGLGVIARLLSSRLDALEKRLPLENPLWKKADAIEAPLAPASKS